MTFATWSFRLAGIVGLIIMLPMIFMEAQIGIDHPPVMNHPEYYYGFVFVTIAWQVVFLIISTDPIRYRFLMPVAVLEKLPFVGAIGWLFVAGRIDEMMVGGAALDLLWGVLFIASFVLTADHRIRRTVPA